MDNYTFALKRPLILPSSTIPKALVFFRQDLFGLSYSMVPNPKEAYMVVSLDIVDLATGKTAMQLDSYTITETGFPTGIIVNQSLIDAWTMESANLNAQLSAKNGELLLKQGEEYDLIAQGKEVPAELVTEIADLMAQVASIQGAIDVLGELPEPIELFINKYSDVVQYFDNKGAITEQGIAWAKQIPFFGLTLGDYIV